MKTAKLVIGIVSIVMSLFVLFQSCVAGIGNTLANAGETSGSSGTILAICLLIAGIVGIAARASKGGAIASGIIYAIGGIIGATNVGTYKDLAIWSVFSFVFAVVFILSAFFGQTYVKKDKGNTKEA